MNICTRSWSFSFSNKTISSVLPRLEAEQFFYPLMNQILHPQFSSTNLAGKLKIARVPLNKDRADEMKTRNMLVQY